MDGSRTPELNVEHVDDQRMSTAMSFHTANQDAARSPSVLVEQDPLDDAPPPPQPNPPTPFRNSAAFSTTQPNSSFESSQLLPPGAAVPFRDSMAPESSALLPNKEEAATPNEYSDAAPGYANSGKGTGKKRFWIFVLGILAAIIIIAVAVAVPLSLRNKNASSSGSSADHGGSTTDGGSGTNGGGTSTTSGAPPTSTAVITGGDGSTITTENGTTFTYSNKFGGFWVWDETDPFNSGAQAQTWSKPLNTSWDWGNDIIRGVNLGGWLVPEPFIAPALYEPYLKASTIAVDEYTLSQNMAADTANGGLSQLEHHYATFITEEDFAQIAGAGLNWVRLPIPFWAVQTFPGEPYLEGVSWKYALKAFQWARKYGIRVNLDLHAVPGSQNGYNHSGKDGQVNFLNGIMGIANAQRTLDYLRVIVEFISQPEYAEVVPLLGVVNEALVSTIGQDVLTSFYLLMHDTLRNITGIGEGHGPYFSIHDGFQGLDKWTGLLPGKDRFAIDTHPYLIFGGDMSTQPVSGQIKTPCNNYADNINASWTAFGVTTAGEWSLAINDCGLWVNGVNSKPRWEGQQGAGACDDWNDWQNWTDDRKQDFQQMALSWMDALQHWFFWTWKIGASSVTGQVETPMWSYSLGLANGWIPPDPRLSTGACGGDSPAGTLSPLQTGGAGSGQISASVRAQYEWPPSLGGLDPASLPTYTATGAIPTLPVATFSSASSKVTALNGWFNAADTRPAYTEIAGCTYPDEYNPGSSAQSCTGADRRAVRNVIPRPRPT